MMLLAALVLLYLPDAESFRSHLSATLKLTCNALPYRTTYVDDRCYVAVLREVAYSDASAECSAIIAGAEVAKDVPAEIFEGMMVDKSKFYSGSASSGAKHLMCSYGNDYKCDAGEAKLVSGRCIVRAPKKMNFLAAKKYCQDRGMELPAPANALENRIFRDALEKTPAWVDKSIGRDNGFKWRQGNAYSKWSTCNYTAGHVPGLYAGSQNKLWQCQRDMGSVVDREGYWSNGGTENQMDVICIKGAGNDFTKGASPCNYHASTGTTIPPVTSATAGAKTCYAPISAAARYEILGKATVETRRGCEVICDAKPQCIAFAFNAAGFSSSCVLLSSATSDACSAPTTIFLKKTTGCAARTNITAEFGEDPCIDQVVPSAFRGVGVNTICDNNKGKLYVLRAIDEFGRRITLDNERHNFIQQWGDMWAWRYQEGSSWSSTRKIIAAACVLAGGQKCPCAPIRHLTNIPDKPNYPVIPERWNPCRGSSSWVWFDVVKAPGYIAYLSQADTARSIVTCKAGMWMLWKESVYSSWGINSLSCYK